HGRAAALAQSPCERDGEARLPQLSPRMVALHLSRQRWWRAVRFSDPPASELTAGLLPPRLLIRRIGPAEIGRQRDGDLAANRIVNAGTKLDRVDAAIEHRKLVDGLRPLVALGGYARGEAVGLGRAVDTKPNVLRTHGDL